MVKIQTRKTAYIKIKFTEKQKWHTWTIENNWNTGKWLVTGIKECDGIKRVCKCYIYSAVFRYI